MSAGQFDRLDADRIALLRELAAEGYGVGEAAEIALCCGSTAAKYAGDIFARNKEATARTRRATMLRLVRANDAALCSADRDAIAARFGLANRNSLKTRVVQAKRKLGLYGDEARA